MMDNLLRHLVFISLYLVLISDAVRRYHYDAKLFETVSHESRYVQFSRTKPELWKDLDKLANASNLMGYEFACTYGDGSWLIYPDKDYTAGDHTHIILLVGGACFLTDNTESMQPLGSMRDPFFDGLVVFSKDFFQSEGKMVTGKNGSFSGEGGSIIFSGDSPWKINDVCLFPVFGGDSHGICLIPSLDSNLRLTGSKTVKPGCEGDKTRIFTGQNCYDTGAHHIMIRHDLNAKAMSGVCGGSGGEDAKGKFGQVMEIWKGRITKGIEDDETIKIPFEAKSMVQLLFKIVGVFHEICPGVSPQYLSILKNIFILHMKNVWAAAKTPPDATLTDDYWKHATLFMDSCYSHFGHGANPLMEDSSCIAEVETPEESDPESGVMWEMIMEHNYDTVIEQVWYIFNAITPSCNLLNEYKTNDWILMGSLLKETFFNPVSVQWEKPGSWQRLYPLMFHGYDIPKERTKILVCVQHALASTPHFDPVGRTKYFARREKEEMMKLMKGEQSKPSGGSSPNETDDGDSSKPSPAEEKDEEKPEEPAEDESNKPNEEDTTSPPPTPPEGDEDAAKRKKRQGRQGKAAKASNRR